jgi:hypothetical protein
MTDEEVRGNLLREIYDLSPTGDFVDSAALTALGLEPVALSRYLADLQNLNLVTMNALPGQYGVFAAAMVKLTPKGIYFILHPDTAPAQVTIGTLHIGDVQTIKLGSEQLTPQWVDLLYNNGIRHLYYLKSSTSLKAFSVAERFGISP